MLLFIELQHSYIKPILAPNFKYILWNRAFEMANCDSCGTSIETAPSGVLVHVDRYKRKEWGTDSKIM